MRPAQNAIDRLREQLGELIPAPTAQDYGYLAPLPLVARDGYAVTALRPLPAYEPSDSVQPTSSAQVPPSSVAPAAQGITPNGPYSKGDALPVWQTRLSGMREFTRTLTEDVAAEDTPLTLSFTAEAGYITIIRRFRFSIEPPLAAVTMASSRLSFLLDGAPVPFCAGIPVESFMPGTSDIYIEANALQTVSVRLDNVDGGGGEDPIEISGRLLVTLYGELRPPVPYRPALTCCDGGQSTPEPLPAPPPIVSMELPPVQRASPPGASRVPTYAPKPPPKPQPAPVARPAPPPPPAPRPAAPQTRIVGMARGGSVSTGRGAKAITQWER